jgi:hypothetical protein
MRCAASGGSGNKRGSVLRIRSGAREAEGKGGEESPGAEERLSRSRSDTAHAIGPYFVVSRGEAFRIRNSPDFRYDFAPSHRSRREVPPGYDTRTRRYLQELSFIGTASHEHFHDA